MSVGRAGAAFFGAGVKLILVVAPGAKVCGAGLASMTASRSAWTGGPLGGGLVEDDADGALALAVGPPAFPLPTSPFSKAIINRSELVIIDPHVCGVFGTGKATVLPDVAILG